MLIKDKTSEREVFEEVFDKRTLMTLYDLMNDGVISEVIGVVKAGKESRLYWGKGRKGEDLAIKIYLTTSAEFKRGMLPYIEGDPRFKRVKRDTHSLVYVWAQKEFKNLKLAYEAGVKVPKPIAVSRNVLVMEFIGEDGMSAPLLKEAEVKDPKTVYEKVLENVKKLYRCGLVHSDLSEYNIMVFDSEVFLFDLSQAVPLEHPMAEEFLMRDIRNLVRFFRKLGLKLPEPESIFKEIVKG
ncbi:serine protein kinase RIO [Candidatus Bathyarchaeota archaeon]|nr:serine protein kinase RIO [Candidatus Bathyarchaeota archaeon]